jgi:hypothetical protein
MLSRKADNPGVVQVSPDQRRTYDTFLPTGQASKSGCRVWEHLTAEGLAGCASCPVLADSGPAES